MSHLTHSRSLGDEPFQQIDYTDNEKTKLNQEKKIEKYKKNKPNTNELTQLIQNSTVLRERRPPPRRKYQPKVIWD